MAPPHSGSATTPKCKQCGKVANALFRDDADGKLYCGPCWKKFYKDFAPESARFVGKQKGPTIPSLPPVPVCGPTAEVDTYFSGNGDDGDSDESPPAVYTDSGVAWSVLLKSTDSKNMLGVCMLQLIKADKCHVVFCRNGKVGSEQDLSTQRFQQLGDAKLLFAELFEGYTGNAWVAIMLDIHNFVPRKDRFNLLADAKAARRAQNDANKDAKEAVRRAEDDKRNAAIAEGTRALLAGSNGDAAPAANGSNGAAKAAPVEEKAPVEQQAATPAKVEPLVKASPAAKPAAAPKAVSPAVKPVVAAKPVSPAVKPAAAKPVSPAVKPVVAKQEVPASPTMKPANKPNEKPSVAAAAAAHAPKAAPKAAPAPVAAAAPAATPAAAKPAAKQAFTVSDEESTQSGGSKLPLIAAGLAVVGIVGFVLARRSKN